jgi:hypothetical protein
VTHWPAPSLRHLARLTDGTGIVEHARGDAPRDRLGYCTDDAGRALALAVRCSTDPDAERVARTSARFLERAWDGGTRFRLRLRSGGWTDDAGSDDANGRAIFGLGCATAGAPWDDVRGRAATIFGAAVAFRSSHPRALAHAILGATAVLHGEPDHRGARALVRDAADLMPRPTADARWPWPEPRLTYGNALVPHAALALARVCGDTAAFEGALALLDWLVREETLGRSFSFVPVSGRGPGDRKPAFDQQPIEAWTMADACCAAYAWTDDPVWAAAARRAGQWFLGANDTGVVMYDPTTGGGYDGLRPHGVNRNQGAESTMAFAGTMSAMRALECTASHDRGKGCT